MKIEISIGEEHLIPEHDGKNVWWAEDIAYEHYAYCDNIDEAIEMLTMLKKREE